ncbi:hypothetical protein KI387_029990, partial [Taxus chinensis]
DGSLVEGGEGTERDVKLCPSQHNGTVVGYTSREPFGMMQGKNCSLSDSLEATCPPPSRTTMGRSLPLSISKNMRGSREK